MMTNETVFNLSAISRGKKIVLIVFIIWLVQAVPKWSAAIMADDETSSDIISFFITPRAELEQHQEKQREPALKASSMTASQKELNPAFVAESES